MFNTIFPKIHKEGYKYLAISIITTFISFYFSKFLGTLFIVITVWIYYFFRDPERYSIGDDKFLVSPADGVITDISERSGPEELRLENTTYTRNTSLLYYVEHSTRFESPSFRGGTLPAGSKWVERST